ncbi:hypothetical protein SEUCBS139899_005918 [Sporothrix eucalyptigena]|uniref:Zn(2)-C6 fungal-type domain-containing protein n=1 Tax=Sporothrix eucalyptigena TaxID=1812306 RepID=A0ABP0AXA7_9PEZI
MAKDVAASPKHPSAAAPYKLGSRSCHGCYQRKVRCDRAVPCGHCERHGLSCVYPAKATAAEEGVTKKVVNLQSIANRLARVEDLLTVLVERTERFDVVESLITKPFAGNVHPSVQAELVQRQRQSQARPSQQPQPTQTQTQTQSQTQQDQQTSAESTWEILLNDGHDERAMPFSGSPSVGNTPQSVNLALQLWSVYVKSVDPVLKILHIPTVQSTVVATILDPKSAAPSTLALTFAIYYAALTSMSDGDTALAVLPLNERHAQLARCKAALDRLLTVAHLVVNADIPSIQALAIYVTCLRVHEVGRSVWVLNGLAIRLAQSIGLHRDGAHLRLSPFETEMRLRLWWHLCVLDSRAPEDQGLQPTIAVTNWELRLPLNVNDSQLYPDMDCLPLDADTWTDMSFFLVQTEACRRMHPIMETQSRQAAAMAANAGLTPGGSTPGTPGSGPVSDPLMQIREKRKIIRDPARYMRARFGIALDSQTATRMDLPRMAIQHMSTACRKMEFVLQLREEIIVQRRDPAPQPVAAILRPSFRSACEALDSSRALLHDSAATPLGWFFGTYTQWYALAYVLRCLCCRPREIVVETQALAEQAWALIDELFPSTLRLHGNDGDEENDGSIWHYLHRLRQQASLVRDEQACMVTGLQGISQPAEPFHTNPLPATSSDGLFSGVDLNTDLNLTTAQNTQDLFSSLDLFMADIQFLPDWDTVINM